MFDQKDDRSLMIKINHRVMATIEKEIGPKKFGDISTRFFDGIYKNCLNHPEAKPSAIVEMTPNIHASLRQLGERYAELVMRELGPLQELKAAATAWVDQREWRSDLRSHFLNTVFEVGKNIMAGTQTPADAKAALFQQLERDKWPNPQGIIDEFYQKVMNDKLAPIINGNKNSGLKLDSPR